MPNLWSNRNLLFLTRFEFLFFQLIKCGAQDTLSRVQWPQHKRGAPDTFRCKAVLDRVRGKKTSRIKIGEREYFLPYLFFCGNIFYHILCMDRSHVVALRLVLLFGFCQNLSCFIMFRVFFSGFKVYHQLIIFIHKKN